MVKFKTPLILIICGVISGCIQSEPKPTLTPAQLQTALLESETRIDEKISKLKEIESTIQDLLKTYDDQQLKKLKSLVSIYEKMKPKDAASIFNSLDMDVLLDITGLMKESKLAVILGNMNGKRAKELTIELATRKQLPDVKGSKG